jgi:hypothetical protein
VANAQAVADPLVSQRELVAALSALGLQASVEYPGYVAVYAGPWCWNGNLDATRSDNGAWCWVFQQQPLDQSRTVGELLIDATYSMARIAQAVQRRVAEVITVGEVLDAEPLDQNLTAQDAIARVNRAQVGSLVTPAGAPLGPANLDYLYTLRNRLFTFTDAVEREIARVAPKGGCCGG